MSRSIEARWGTALLQRLLLAGCLLLTASVKLLDDSGRAQALTAMHIGPHLRYWISALEIAIAIVVLSRRWVAGVYLSLGFAACAAAYLVAMTSLGLDLETCGCFGSRRVSVAGHSAILAGILLLSVSALTRLAKKPSR